MKKLFLFAALFIGICSSCSNNDTPEIPDIPWNQMNLGGKKVNVELPKFKITDVTRNDSSLER